VDDPAREAVACAAQGDLVQLSVQVDGGEDLDHPLVDPQPAERLDYGGAELVVVGGRLLLGALACLALGAPALGGLLLAHRALDWDAAAAALASCVPVEVRLLDPIAARAVGAAGESGLLVRPDGKPAAVLPGVGAPAVALRHQVGAVAA
jgi:hypothetical protein